MAKTTPGGPKLHALLIAADCYLENEVDGGTYPSLAGCVRDVTHVETFLKDRLKVPPERIAKLTSTNNGKPTPPEPAKQRPTYDNIVRAFRDLAGRADPGDQVYVHYSGHGGRAPTAYPKRKGKDGLDECLVPIDIGDDSARYVRDLEVAALLKLLTDKGLGVTLVLDSCHSGGATRGQANNVAVRGVNFVDRRVRPPGDVDIPADLLGKSTAQSRKLNAASGFLIEPKGYTLLAACRPHESAYEFAFKGTERNGALTYWMLDALEGLTSTTTYQDIYDRVLAQVHGQFALQTPMLEGDARRVVFGEGVVPDRATVLVTRVIDKGNVMVGAGQASGLRSGAQLAIYARGEADIASASKRKGVVEVDELGATESHAILAQPIPRKAIQAGDQAVLLGSGSTALIRKVRLIRADGKPATAKDKSLQAVGLAIEGKGWVELAAKGEPADFLVTLNPESTEYELCDRAGVPIANLRPPLRVDDPGAAEAVVRRLVHLARYRAVQDLDNFDRTSPLRGKLVAEIVGIQADYDPVAPPDPRPLAKPGQVPTLAIGETAFLKISNTSGQVLNVVVLDLGPDWSVAQAFPGGQNLDFEPLDPGRSLDLIPLVANLPEGYETGTDLIKVFATLGNPNFRALTLPALDQPAVPKGRRGGGASDPLDALLAEVAADRPRLRSLTARSSPTGEWAVVSLPVQIAREVKTTGRKARPRKT